MIDGIKNNVKRNKLIYVSYAVAVIMFLIPKFLFSGFGVGAHAVSLSKEIAILALLAIGQTFVIMTGGIDISIPWNMNCAAILLTYLCERQNEKVWWVVLLIVGLCTAVGFINGIGVAYLKIPAIIMTLGMNSVVMGGMLALLKGAGGDKTAPIVGDFCNGFTLGIPNLVVVMLVFAIIGVMLLHFSTYGRKLFALGSNERAAFFTGVNTKMTKVMAHTFCGLCAGVAGMLYAGRLQLSYLGMCEDFTFKTIIAVAFGGTSLMGGSGSCIGSIAGAAMIILLTATEQALLLPTSAQNIIYGVVLVLAIILIPDENRKRL